MADRNNYGRQDFGDDNDRSSSRDRQPEQFQAARSYYVDSQSRGYGQMGDDHSQEDYSQSRYGQQEDARYGDNRPGSSWREDDNGSRNRGQSYGAGTPDDFGQRRISNRERSGFNSFNSEDFRTAGSVGPKEHQGYGRGDSTRDAYTRGSYGPGTYGVAPRRDYGESDSRGFFEKAGDEVASWFGDEEAAQRREMDHRGRGPANYTRSDDRILEDTCDKLTEDWGVDARNIQVTVQNGEVTLDGTVEDRRQKRRAEDIVHDLSGVSHVQNNLRTSDKGKRENSGQTTNEPTATADRNPGSLA